MEDEREMNAGIRDFIKEINKLDGKRVNITITHILYGNQNIETYFKIIDDASRLGFKINDQEIYIEKEGLCNFGIIEGTYYFASDLMRIELKTV